jgi:hypothetical protein
VQMTHPGFLVGLACPFCHFFSLSRKSFFHWYLGDHDGKLVIGVDCPQLSHDLCSNDFPEGREVQLKKSVKKQLCTALDSIVSHGSSDLPHTESQAFCQVAARLFTTNGLS